ncbi:MAG TPA: metalloregulator ArsR/SmtB family transcription factor [Acidobacteriota bacterium]|nr:metalloregulator ArsR/SmtB family transcription factor [Acidobacteriota bacterium]
MNDFPAVNLFRALGDESRLRAVLVLRRHELCVCQIVELLGLAPSTVSKHLAILREAGLIEARKMGRWVHYRTAPAPGGGLPGDQLSAILDSLATTRPAHRDDRRLKEILKLDPEVLCEKQRRG